MITRFDQYWSSAVKEDYVTFEVYYDVAQEICPVQASNVASSVPKPNIPVDAEGRENHVEDNLPAEPLLWKRCCLES